MKTAEKPGTGFPETLTQLRKEADAAIVRIGKRLDGPDEKGLIVKMREAIDRILSMGEFIGEVVSFSGDPATPEYAVLVSSYGKVLSLKPVPGLQLYIGDTVALAPNTSQIVRVIERFDVGSICVISRVISTEKSEVSFNGTPRVVSNGRYGTAVHDGDRIILDSSGSVITAHLGKGDNRFKLVNRPNVSWNDICGLDKEKEELRDIIRAQVDDSELVDFYHLERPKGVLLIGSPGCGKTMLIEAMATELGQTRGENSLDEGFIMIKGPEILEPLVGNAERAIRALFIRARKYKERTGLPAIIAIDECDAILQKRGTSISSDVQNTIVPTFLTEMNGVDDSSAIVVLATNRPDVLDPAAIRDERIDLKLVVPRPVKETARVIFEKRLKKFPLASGQTPQDLAIITADAFYSSEYTIYEIIRVTPGEIGSEKREVIPFRLSNLISGAMAVGVIKGAVRKAFRRDRQAGGSKDPAKRTGVTKEDLLASIKDVFEQNRPLNHKDDLAEFVADYRDQVVGIKPTRQVQGTES